MTESSAEDVREPYLFHGVVLPERAQLSLQSQVEFTQGRTGNLGQVRISIVLNQVAVWVDSDWDWDIFDLRNVVKNIVGNELAMLGYLKGHAYEFEMTRVLSRGRGIDYVFGIDLPFLSGVSESDDLTGAMSDLREKGSGPAGVFLLRCFRDLVSAMKEADDTAFYCYRAIESLRNHCATTSGLMDAEWSAQWDRFRGIAGCEESTLRNIKDAADPVRHGHPTALDGPSRQCLLVNTWGVVRGYVAAL